MSSDPQKMRIDKWLWCVRLFKTRTLATEACRSGKVKIKGLPAKASVSIEPGIEIEIKKDGFNFRFKVVRLLKSRVGAPIAQTCLENVTPVEEMNKYKEWFVGKGGPERRDRGAGRPSKLERRQLDDFKSWWEEEE